MVATVAKVSMQPAYLLAHGIKQQIASDQRECARELAQFIVAERPFVRALDTVLRNSDDMTAAFAVINGLRCFARVHAGGTGGVLACGLRPNEQRVLRDVRALVPELAWDDVEFDLWRAPASLTTDLAGVVGLVATAKRLSRVARQMRGRDLVPALRSIELIAYYARLGQLLEAGRHRVALISSYTNPWGIALNVAARRRGLPVVLVSHGAPVGQISRLDYDVAVLDTYPAVDAFRAAGCRIDRPIVRSMRSTYGRMRPVLPARATVGVFLSKDPTPQVRAWIDHLLGRADVGHVVVRPHPSQPDSALLREASRLAHVEVSKRRTCIADLERCDFAIVGNSTVLLEAVTAGIPTAFVPALDGDAPDSYGFAASGLVRTVTSHAYFSMSDVHAFYRASGWTDILRRHVELERSEADVAEAIRGAILGVVT